MVLKIIKHSNLKKSAQFTVNNFILGEGASRPLQTSCN
jgi:hypothetical protein